jgi:hypothetical protein
MYIIKDFCWPKSFLNSLTHDFRYTLLSLKPVIFKLPQNNQHFLTRIPKDLSNMYSSASSRVRMNQMKRVLADWADKQSEPYEYEIFTSERREIVARDGQDAYRRDDSEWDEQEIEFSNPPSSPKTQDESSLSTTQNVTPGSRSSYRARSFHKRQPHNSIPSWAKLDKLERVNKLATIKKISTIKWCNDNREAIEKLHSSSVETEIFNHQCSGCDKWFKHCMFSNSRIQNKLCHWCNVNSDAEKLMLMGEKKGDEKKKDEKKMVDFNIHQHIHCNGLRENICGKFKMDLKYIPNHPSQRSPKRRIEELEDSSESSESSKSFESSESKLPGRKRKLTEKARENKNLSQK